MNNRIKATWVSIGIVSILTLFKFLFFYISGSLAVLSEAWHSFSDIATSVFVLISLYRVLRLEKRGADKSEEQPLSGNFIVRIFRKIIHLHPELQISFVIGIMLTSISVSILWNAFCCGGIVVDRPLISGIAFILFSLGSYFLYRFQISMGEKEGSAALYADGMHSKADMIGSLLTGVSLILYHFSFNFDRFVGAFIGILLFSVALEMLVNSTLALIKGQEKFSREYSAVSIIAAFFSENLYRKLWDKIHESGNFTAKSRAVLKDFYKFAALFFKLGLLLSALGLVGYYLKTALVFVRIDEKAIVLRFGKIVNRDELYGPGIHFKFPVPFENVVYINTKKIYSIDVGNSSSSGSAMIWTSEHGDSVDFISGDNNLFLPYVTLHYRVDDPYLFYVGVKGSSELIRHISYSVLTKTFSERDFYDLAIFKRREWIDFARGEMQKKFNSLDMGVRIEELVVKDLHPPIKIANAFEKVVAAYQLKERDYNNAEGYINMLIPKTRADALRTASEATSYVRGKVLKAEGDAENYVLRLAGYKESRSVMRKYLFYKHAGETLSRGKKVVVDPKSGIPSQVIYSEKFFFRGGKR